VHNVWYRCCASSCISSSSIPLPVPSSDHLLVARVPSASKGGARKVPTLASKSLICCSHKNRLYGLKFESRSSSCRSPTTGMSYSSVRIVVTPPPTSSSSAVAVATVAPTRGLLCPRHDPRLLRSAMPMACVPTAQGPGAFFYTRGYVTLTF
jgi:hypothetical protein